MTPIPARKSGSARTGWVLGGTAILLMPIALFAPKGVAVLFVIAATLVFVMTFDAGRIRSILKQPISRLLAAFIVFAVISATWSIAPASSLRSALTLGLAFFSGLYLIDTMGRLGKADRDLVFSGIIVGGVLGLSLIAFEHSTNGLLTRLILAAKGRDANPATNFMPALNSGMSVLALYAWPWALVLKSRFGAAVMVLGLLVCGGLIFLSNADTPVLALLAGFVIAVLSLPSKKGVLAIFAVIAGVGIAAAPLLPGALPDPHTEARAYSKLSHSGVHRLVIWRTAAEHIAKSPVLGIGMNGTRFLYNSSDRIIQKYATDDPAMTWGNYAEPIPLHTHNGILQIWLELGGIGALLFAAVLLMVLWRLRQGGHDAITTAARLGMLVSGIVIFSLSFGPWQGWWQSAIWLSIAMMSATKTPETP